MPRHRVSGPLLGASLAAVLVLSGCSDGGSGDAGSGSASPSSSSSASSTAAAAASASASPYLPVPAGVTLTGQGSKLRFGDKAVVAYEPRQQQVGALAIRVTKVQRTTFEQSFKGWKLDAATLRTTPYFVDATVTNVGATDLGGRPVPLYIVDGHNTLIEASSFASSFEPCPSKPLPKKFGNGDKVKTCLVFLAPDKGDLTAVSFRPTQAFDPITWTGDVEPPRVKVKASTRKGG